MNYQVGLQRLQALAPERMQAEFRVLEARLLDNLKRERLYGSTETIRAERAATVAALNELALEISKTSFNELCQPAAPDVVDFLIVHALTEERDAMLAKLENVRPVEPAATDVPSYFEAEVRIGDTGRRYRIAVVTLLGMGRVKAATTTSDAIRRWNPGYVLLVGIAGGLAVRGVERGDILIADQVVDYELQKLGPGGPIVRYEVYRTDARLYAAAQNLKNDWTECLSVQPPQPKRATKPIFGPIATGDKVVAADAVLDRYAKEWPKMIGVEMEAGGVAAAVSQSPGKPGFFMVRAVSDLADQHKDDPALAAWWSFACDAASAFAACLLRSGPVPAR